MDIGIFHPAPQYSIIHHLVAIFTPDLHVLVKYGGYQGNDRYEDISQHIPVFYREAVIKGKKLRIQGSTTNPGKPPFKIDIMERARGEGFGHHRSMTPRQRGSPWYGDQAQHRNPQHPCRSCGSPWTQHHASTAKPGTTALSHAYEPA